MFRQWGKCATIVQCIDVGTNHHIGIILLRTCEKHFDPVHLCWHHAGAVIRVSSSTFGLLSRRRLFVPGFTRALRLNARTQALDPFFREWL
jgi:hypothetical protein